MQALTSCSQPKWCLMNVITRAGCSDNGGNEQREKDFDDNLDDNFTDNPLSTDMDDDWDITVAPIKPVEPDNNLKNLKTSTGGLLGNSDRQTSTDLGDDA